MNSGGVSKTFRARIVYHGQMHGDRLVRASHPTFVLKFLLIFVALHLSSG